MHGPATCIHDLVAISFEYSCRRACKVRLLWLSLCYLSVTVTFHAICEFPRATGFANSGRAHLPSRVSYALSLLPNLLYSSRCSGVTASLLWSIRIARHLQCYT